MKGKLINFYQEIKSYSAKEKLFILFAVLVGFCITSEYAITKPTSNSIFISLFTTKYCPVAWLLMVPLNLFMVSIYNKLLAKLGQFKTLISVATTVITINTCTAIFAKSFPGISFFHYIFKDIYVLLMFQQLWSVIHTVIPMKRARYLYGIMFGIGGIGAVMGSIVPSFFAVKAGSLHLLYCTIPIYLLLITGYYFALRTSKSEMKEVSKKETPTNKSAIKLIADSKYLKFILAVVVLMQITSTIIEFQFIHHLEKKIPQLDYRTEYFGRVFGMINTMNLFFQFVGSFLFVKLIGLRRSHFVIPSILFLNILSSLVFPVFALITYSFSVIKSFDYSVFAVIKEMLYNPLTKEEKFKAKAFIDVFAYRTARALASLLIMAVSFWFPVNFGFILSWGAFFVVALWLVTVFALFREDIEEKYLQAT